MRKVQEFRKRARQLAMRANQASGRQRTLLLEVAWEWLDLADTTEIIECAKNTWPDEQTDGPTKH